MTENEFRATIIAQAKELDTPIAVVLSSDTMAGEFEPKRYADHKVFIASEFDTMIEFEAIGTESGNLGYQVLMTKQTQEKLVQYTDMNFSNNWRDMRTYIETVTYEDGLLFIRLIEVIVGIDENYKFDFLHCAASSGGLHFDCKAKKFVENWNYVSDFLDELNACRRLNDTRYIQLIPGDDIIDDVVNAMDADGVDSSTSSVISELLDNAVHSTWSSPVIHLVIALKEFVYSNEKGNK